MIDIANRLWGQLCLPGRQGMLHLVYLCLMMSYPQYKVLCHRNYVERPMVAKFLTEVTEQHGKQKTIINAYAKIDRFL
jgi:hypothetical protein